MVNATNTEAEEFHSHETIVNSKVKRVATIYHKVSNATLVIMATCLLRRKLARHRKERPVRTVIQVIVLRFSCFEL